MEGETTLQEGRFKRRDDGDDRTRLPEMTAPAVIVSRLIPVKDRETTGNDGYH